MRRCLAFLLMAGLILAPWRLASAAGRHQVFLPVIQALPGEPPRELTLEEQVLQLINERRAEAGLPALVLAPELAVAADAHSMDMANSGTFSHAGSDGSTVADRLESVGYHWRSCGEIIGAGYTTPAAVVQGWMDSPGHRNIMLGRNWTEMGAGYVQKPGSPYTHYWTVDFGVR